MNKGEQTPVFNFGADMHASPWKANVGGAEPGKSSAGSVRHLFVT